MAAAYLVLYKGEEKLRTFGGNISEVKKLREEYVKKFGFKYKIFEKNCRAKEILCLKDHFILFYYKNRRSGNRK